MTTIGFFPPSSRHGDCKCRPHSSPIARPTSVDPVKPTLSTAPRRAPRTALLSRWAVELHDCSTSVGHTTCMEQRHRAPPRRRWRSPPASRRPHSRRGTLARGTTLGRPTGKFPAVMTRDHTDRNSKSEQLLVGHLARHGLAVQPPPLAEEEVAGVDNLLHLTERLRVRLADLARDQARERLLVLLYEATDLLDRLAAHRCRDRGPLALSRARGATGVYERVRIPQPGLADDLVEVGRVARLDALPALAVLSADDRSDGPRVGDAHGPSVPASRGRAAVGPTDA